MGESRASGEGILGDFFCGEVRCNEDDYSSFMQNTDRLCSFSSDKLKCVHCRSFGYNKSKFNFGLEASLMVSGKEGEKNFA